MIEEIGEPFIRLASNLLAYRLRFESLPASGRPCCVAKIPKADKNLKELNLGLRHRPCRVPKYTFLKEKVEEIHC